MNVIKNCMTLLLIVAPVVLYGQESIELDNGTIDHQGLLTPINDGVVTVTALAKDGSGKTGSIKITINDTGQKTAWEFSRDLQGWDNNTHDGGVSHSDGALKFTIEGGDPYVNNNVFQWKVGGLKFIWIRI